MTNTRFCPYRMYVEFHNPYEDPKCHIPLLLAIRAHNDQISYEKGYYAIPQGSKGYFYHYIAGVPPFDIYTPYFIGWMYLSELDQFVEKSFTNEIIPELLKGDK